jgi:hypothetical protein
MRAHSPGSRMQNRSGTARTSDAERMRWFIRKPKRSVPPEQVRIPSVSADFNSGDSY